MGGEGSDVHCPPASLLCAVWLRHTIVQATIRLLEHLELQVKPAQVRLVAGAVPGMYEAHHLYHHQAT